ncbi:MAG: hypothetical protein KC636_11340 [Myxococcales bacterium]|nr:hypothetical protein [Myxococcales bacterium]
MTDEPSAALTEGDVDAAARHARAVLLLIAGFQLVGATVLGAGAGVDDRAALGSSVALALAFAGLAAWARREPLPPILVALALWATHVAYIAATAPASMTWGIAVKIGIAALLVHGVRVARAHRVARRALQGERRS